jgi:hypothetical protein
MATSSQTSTLISWKINKLSRSKVFFDTKPLVVLEALGHAYEPEVKSGYVVPLPTYATSTAVELRHLTPNTTYHYFVISIDRTGNVTASYPSTFTTK